METISVIWENKVSLRRNEPLETGYRPTKRRTQKAVTLNKLSIWMENSTSGRTEFKVSKIEKMYRHW